MNGYDCSERLVLHDNEGSETGGIGHLSASSGTFSLRRFHYFAESAKALFSTDPRHALTNIRGEFNSKTLSKNARGYDGYTA